MPKGLLFCPVELVGERPASVGNAVDDALELEWSLTRISFAAMKSPPGFASAVNLTAAGRELGLVHLRWRGPRVRQRSNTQEVRL